MKKKQTNIFFQQKKQKQNKKHIKNLPNEQGQLLKMNSETLEKCKSL